MVEEYQDRRSQIETLYSQGKGQREIAREMGISQPAVRKHLITLGILRKKDESVKESAGEDMVLKFEEGQCMMITAWEKAPWSTDNYIARCKYCHGFFITGRKGQIYCCNACAAGKPCTCGTAKRGRIIID